MPYPWPKVPGVEAQPVWTGRGFRVGDRAVAVLSFAAAESGWSDDLTTFHEESAGGSHPIDVASRSRAVGELVRLAQRCPRPTVLEAGSSSGFLLRDIRRALPEAQVIGSDFVAGPLERLAEEMPDIPLLQFDLTDCPLPSASVDAVVLLNVLEHIQDDAAALRQVQRILRPGGILVLEVPAGPELFDVYDRLLMHYRRYRMPELRKLVAANGLQVRSASHLGALIYPAFYLVKRWNKRYLSETAATQRSVVERDISTTRASFGGLALKMVFALESALGQRVVWPVGIRCLITAEKPRR
jgi:SAM-dependent methyltransferase